MLWHLKYVPAVEYIDCENIVICNRAGWDENQPRLQGTSPTPTPWDKVRTRTRLILSQQGGLQAVY